MNRILWVLQVGLGVFFVAFGVVHLVVPEGLPGPAEWVYELSTPVHVVAGTAEILGGLGLILPAATRIAPWLTPLAALGLIAVMLGAVAFHAGRDEFVQLVLNLGAAAALAVVAYGRWRLHPIPPRRA
jgi:uncharacterized membrane protein